MAFTDRDITADDTAMADLQKIGFMTTSVTVVDGQAIVGFDVPKLIAALGL